MRPVALLLGLSLAFSSSAAPRRFALLIGSNRGDPGEEPLHYAASDAERMARVLMDVGGFAPEDVQVLTSAEASSVRRALIFLNSRVRDEADGALLFVFYSGHGDASSIHLDGDHLDLAEFKALLHSSPASVRVLVIDACRSGGITMVKGGHPAPAFQVEVQNELSTEGTALLASSAASEDSQESEELKASVFTHFLASALLRAGDANGDGQVALGEAFAYASERTTASTASSWSGPQHPSYKYELGGRGELVLTRPLRGRRGLGSLAFLEPGRYVVHRGAPDGPLVAEVMSERGVRYLALPADTYVITERFPHFLLEGTVMVGEGAVAAVRTSGLHRVDYARVVRKGGTLRGSAWSGYLEAGAQTPVLELGVQAAGAVGIRFDGRALSLEVRADLGSSEHENRAVQLQTQRYGLSVAALRAFDLGPLTLSIGLSAGGAVWHQRFFDPRNPPRNALAGQIGPVGTVEVPIRARLLMRLRLGAPTVLVRTQAADGTQSLASAFSFEALAGVGMYF